MDSRGQAGQLRARVPQLLGHLVVEGGRRRRHLPALIEVAARHARQIRIEGAVEEAVRAGPPRLYCGNMNLNK